MPDLAAAKEALQNEVKDLNTEKNNLSYNVLLLKIQKEAWEGVIKSMRQPVEKFQKGLDSLEKKIQALRQKMDVLFKKTRRLKQYNSI